MKNCQDLDILTTWPNMASGMGPNVGGAAGALRASAGRTFPGQHGGGRGQEAIGRNLQEGDPRRRSDVAT